MKALMLIPKNLVYVFLLVIIFAFGCMIYVVVTEKNLSSFVSQTSGYFNEHNEQVVVHPLFQHFKQALATLDEVPRYHLKDLTSKMFYREYLTNNLPVLVEDGCQLWPAIKKWQDTAYVSQEFGQQSIAINKVGLINKAEKALG